MDLGRFFGGPCTNVNVFMHKINHPEELRFIKDSFRPGHSITSLRQWRRFVSAWCGSGSLIGLVKKNGSGSDLKSRRYQIFKKLKFVMLQKITFYASYEGFFMCLKQKCIFILKIMIFLCFFNRFLCEFLIILADFSYADSDAHYSYGSGRPKLYNEKS